MSDFAASASGAPSLTTTLIQLQAVKYSYVASFAVLIYDYSITLDLEIKYLLNTRWGFTKFLYLLCRYTAFADALLVLYYELGSKMTSKVCFNIFWSQGWFTVVGIYFAESILILRTYILWNRDRNILYILLTTFVAASIISFIALDIFLRPLNFGLVLGSCAIISGARAKVLLMVFTALPLLEIVILSLTMYVGIKYFRHSTSPILTTLYRDGILYFIFSTLFSLGNIITVAVLPLAMYNILVHPQRVMHSIFSTRLILHLHSTDSSTGIRPTPLTRGLLFWRRPLTEHFGMGEVGLVDVARKL